MPLLVGMVIAAVATYAILSIERRGFSRGNMNCRRRASFPPSPGLDALRAQVAQAQSQFVAMGQVPNPSGQPSLALTPMEK